MRYRLIAVIGQGTSDPETDRLAAEVGHLIGAAGVSMVTGGLGGVMTSASAGFIGGAATLPHDKRGVVLGVLPGTDASGANPHVDVVVPSGMGEARNYLVVVSAAAVIAVGRGHGTLAEIGYSLKLGKPLVGLRTWTVGDEIMAVETAGEAVRFALSHIV